MDGTELVQQPIQPGETFQYRFVLPDPGTFYRSQARLIGLARLVTAAIIAP